jgi:pimeloyl-ACP methyl ester carboxylesterase
MAVSFVLVHGASHGAWCWGRTVPHLEADPRVGAVVAIDLPGRPGARDPKPVGEIRIADYVRCIADEIESRDLHEVILVGHSLAGLSIPHAAARVAPRMRRLVHLATSCPPEGATVMQLMQHATSPLSRGLAGDPVAMFCNDLDEPTTAWLVERLVEEPPGVLVEPVVRADLPPDLPTTYILLEQDATLLPAFQVEQARAANVDEIVRFDSGHSAFAARPRELADLLLRWA